MDRRPGGHKLFVEDQDYYDQHDIELRLGSSVTALDVSSREVVLPEGEQLGYDALLLATRTRARRLHVPRCQHRRGLFTSTSARWPMPIASER